jgi:hypothetical protein
VYYGSLVHIFYLLATTERKNVECAPIQILFNAYVLNFYQYFLPLQHIYHMYNVSSTEKSVKGRIISEL